MRMFSALEEQHTDGHLYVYDEIYVYKNIIPASVKDLETETTKMSPNN
mgnify:CR=1 FL=1